MVLLLLLLLLMLLLLLLLVKIFLALPNERDPSRWSLSAPHSKHSTCGKPLLSSLLSQAPRAYHAPTLT